MIVSDEARALSQWTESASEKIANSVSHAVGLVGALIGTPILLVAAFQNGRTAFFIGTVVFSITMSMVYLSSTLYHAWPQTRAKEFLRLFDHSAIYFLIAGTYTPFALGPLRATIGPTLLVAIWALALIGVAIKIVRGTSRHRGFALGLYLTMGWLAVLVLRPFASALSAATIVWLFAGGIAYTLGVLFFVNERRRYAHFVWHLFVLTGTSCHFAAVLSCAS
ncbi:MAG TPA: hemolysin III family protein [Chthoniobacterales bacterium]|jgi:hemolysin III